MPTQPLTKRAKDINRFYPMIMVGLCYAQRKQDIYFLEQLRTRYYAHGLDMPVSWTDMKRLQRLSDWS